MRLWLCTGLVLLAGASVRAEESPGFARILPEGVGDVTAWSVVTGDFETAQARGAYRLYVSPRFQAIYRLMRYRVELLAPTSDLERRRLAGERVAFVQRPGSREPILCWEPDPQGSGLGWRELPAGTDEYLLEMAMLMRVLAIHRAARAALAP